MKPALWLAALACFGLFLGLALAGRNAGAGLCLAACVAALALSADNRKG